MPAGLADMSGRRRRPGARTRRTVRWAVGTVVMLAAVLAPVDATRLPDSADDLFGTLPAQAQTHGITNGELTPCDPGWAENVDDESLCESSAPACPKPFVVPIDSTDPETVAELPAFTRSVDYPEFCEALVPYGTVMYDACTTLGSSTGGKEGDGRTWTVVRVDPVECSMTVPAKCPDTDPDTSPATSPDKMNRIGADSGSGDVCVAFRRRTWSCDDIGGIEGNDGIPMNQFGQCYIEPPPPSGTDQHPACDDNSPSVPIVSCRDYVGSDYLEFPALTRCDSYNYEFHAEVGATTVPRTVYLDDYSANPGHWCTWSPAHLDCHSEGVSCATTTAYCVKRNIEGTGCDGIAAALECRSLYFALGKSTRTAADVENAGCRPCVVLPFSAAPDSCPLTLRETPPVSESRYTEVHQLRADWRGPGKGPPPWERCVLYDIGDPRHPDYYQSDPRLFACPWRQFCADPAPGHVTWEASNSAGIALVGSRLVLRVEDLPTQRHARNWLTVLGPNLRLWGINQMHYADNSVVRTSLQTLNYVPPVPTQWLQSLKNLGECVASDYPRYRIRIEELWPDVNRQEIIDLFGMSAVAWWDDLLDDAAREAAIEAQGLNYVNPADGLDMAEQGELDRRAGILGYEVHCQVGPEVWCPWEPRRAGYHRLTAVGAWHMEVFLGHRQWHRGIAHIDTALTLVTSSGSCDHDPNERPYDPIAAGRDYECILEHLEIEKPADLTNPSHPDVVALHNALADFGIRHAANQYEFVGLLPRPSSVPNAPQEAADQWLYSDAADDGTYACPPLKMRARCGAYNRRTDAYNYTESASIGVAVYQVRTTTRRTSR